MKGSRLLSSACMRDAVTLCDGPNIASDFTGFFPCPISKDSATLLLPYAIRMVACVLGFNEVFSSSTREVYLQTTAQHGTLTGMYLSTATYQSLKIFSFCCREQ